ncbi:titin homolog [Anopheles marshallii]|uniref:titin homolog n=1 Tax=Anopheles marshallii TaxID=1521116 RepID=UPI00237B8733|nr:titin homolog [Anopheles marshallii]
MPISAPKIPDGLPELMRGLAKSVIKENPENLYVHAAEYFENLIRERDGHLDQGYQTFNAYQVYADYKEKTREKLGLTKDPSLSDGIGGDGDESGSGGSESKIRGRKRRRARKPSSRERENPVTMVGNPSVSDEGEPQKLKSLSDDSAPVPVVEQEIVKVHYNPPEAVPSPVRVVSAQSVEAEQAVSSILDDGLILNSDGNDGKETGDELADNGDDIGTAPSTAEITERTVAVDVESSAAVALQDMETCFMHANVDDLLEKHTEDQPELEANDVGVTAGNETTVLSALEGEDIPEGPQILGETDTDVPEVDQTPEIEKPEENNNENQLQKVSEEQLQIEVEEIISSSPIVVQSVVEALVEEIETKETEDQANAQPAKDAEEAVSSSNEPAVEEIVEASVDQSKLETDNLSDGKDMPANVVSNTKVDEGNGEDPIVSAEITSADEQVPSSPNNSAVQEHVPSEPASNEVETLLGKENEQSVVEIPEDASPISSRMGFEQDESVGNDDSENALLAPVDTESSLPSAADPKVQEAMKTEELNITDQPNDIELNDKCVKDEANEILNQIDDIVPNSPVNEDSLNDNDIIAKDAKDQPSEVAPSESISIAEQMEEKTKPAQEDSSNAEDIKDDKVKKEDEASEPQNDNETSNASNITTEPISNDVTVETTKENIDFVEPAGISEETVLTDTRSNELSTDRIVNPQVDDRDEEPQEEILESNAGMNDDLKSQNVDKNEKSDPQSNDNEVNEKHNETDQNDLLTKDQSLEDVAHVVEVITNSANDAVITSADLIAEESVPIIPVDPAEDSLSTNTEQGHEDNIQPNVVPVTEQDGGVVQKNGMHHKEFEEVKVEDDSKIGEYPEAIEPTVQGISTDADPTLENVVMDEMQKLLQDDKNDTACPKGTLDGDNDSGNFNKGVADTLDDVNEVDEKDAILASAPIDERSGDIADIPSETNLEGSLEKPVLENDELSDLSQSVIKQSSSDSAIEPKNETLVDPVDPSALADEEPKQKESLEEVVEEPCVKREISPSKSVRLEKDDSSEKQVEELEEIKKVDLSQLSKDSAEALFYTLKKSELENQEPEKDTVGNEEESPKVMVGTQQQTTEDDDQDVVVKEEPEPIPEAERTKRTFTDDFLDENPITEPPTTVAMPSDGGGQDDPLSIGQDRASLDAEEQKDEFNPMVMVSMRSKQYQEQLHSGGVAEKVDPEVQNEGTPKRPMMRRCMTEMSGLQRYDAAMEDELVDTRPEDPSYVEEEDQFDGYYIGHIKNKILASSVSVADSDCPDGTRSSVESVDENNVRTALETIASTDTESTIASQATIQQAGPRSYLRKHSQNTSSNIPYASFGNAAIDQSLDEFIEREEQHKQDEAMAEAATKIQRSYRTHKKKLLRDYHSTMRTFTEDHSAESGEEYAANVIQIKLDQRRTEADPTAGDGGEESDTTTGGKVGLGATGKRPMYSLNIDEYDTVARRMTLTRGVAMQRNSTPDDDSGKSANVSTDRRPSLNSPIVKDSMPASESGERPSSDEKPAGPDTTDRSSSDEPEQKAAHSSSRSKPKSSPPVAVNGPEQVPRTVTSRTTFAPLDVQNLLLIARQRTMPVQIDSSVIRVLPKHMRKRISSAGMLNTNGKRK